MLYIIFLLCPTVKISHVIEWLACALAGALFPDIDIKSKGQKYFYWVIFILLVGLAIQERLDLFMVVSIGAIIPMLVRHRGLFHNLWFLIALAGGFWIFFSTQFPFLSQRLFSDILFFLAGVISHLWLDRGFRRMIRF
jgi:hypothetical protein